MAYPLRQSLTLTAILLVLLNLITPTHALSVAKKAAVGISVGFGSLLLVSLAAILYLKFSPARRAERRAKRDQEAHGSVTDADAIEFHAREQQRNFNIWDYDHNKVMAAKKAAKEREQQAQTPKANGAQEHGTVETVA